MTKLEVLELLESLFSRADWLEINKRRTYLDDGSDAEWTIDVKDLIAEIYRDKLSEYANENN